MTGRDKPQLYLVPPTEPLAETAREGEAAPVVDEAASHYGWCFFERGLWLEQQQIESLKPFRPRGVQLVPARGPRAHDHVLDAADEGRGPIAGRFALSGGVRERVDSLFARQWTLRWWVDATEILRECTWWCLQLAVQFQADGGRPIDFADAFSSEKRRMMTMPSRNPSAFSLMASWYVAEAEGFLTHFVPQEQQFAVEKRKYGQVRDSDAHTRFLDRLWQYRKWLFDWTNDNLEEMLIERAKEKGRYLPDDDKAP